MSSRSRKDDGRDLACALMRACPERRNAVSETASVSSSHASSRVIATPEVGQAARTKLVFPGALVSTLLQIRWLAICYDSAARSVPGALISTFEPASWNLL